MKKPYGRIALKPRCHDRDSHGWIALPPSRPGIGSRLKMPAINWKNAR